MLKIKSFLVFFMIISFPVSGAFAQFRQDIEAPVKLNMQQQRNTVLLPPIGETENTNSLLIGLTIPTGRLSTQVRPGFAIGYDFNFNFERNVDLFLNVTGNLFSTKKSDSISTVERIVDIAVLLEYTVGPRIYFDLDERNKGKYKLSTELGIGFYTPIGTQYVFDESGSFSGIEGISDVLRGGINIGVGGYITGNRTIIIKLKYHKLFSIPTQYFGIYGGVVL